MLNSIKLIISKAEFAYATLQKFDCKESELGRYSVKPQVVDHQAVFTQWMTEHERLLCHIITGFEAKSLFKMSLFKRSR